MSRNFCAGASCLIPLAFLAAAACTGDGMKTRKVDLYGDVTQRTFAVYVGDLDLKTAAGKASLNERLLSAAKKVCTEDGDIRDRDGRHARKKCIADTLTAATHGPVITAGAPEQIVVVAVSK
jgi:UrcA family protein